MRFGGSVFYNYREGKAVQARALGARALHQLIKCVRKAQYIFAQHDLLLTSTFDIEHGQYGGEEMAAHTVTFHIQPRSALA